MTKVIVDAYLAYRKNVRGDKPSIVRTNRFKDRGWSVKTTPKGNFVAVNMGKTVEYYGNPFYRLHRIVSIPDTPDYVTHAVHK